MEKRIWHTQFNNHGRIKSNHGERMHKLYGGVYDDSGRLRLDEKGEESIYDYIQSFADSVDIRVILKRFANGESDVLSKVQGFYGDFSHLPTDYAQLLNTVQAGEDMFKSLPVDVRAKFGHSFNEFMTALCDGSLMGILGDSSVSSSSDSEPSSSGSEPSPTAE